MFDYLIVGAGFAGSVLAERLARGSNKKVLLVDRRPHIGGNAYDCYDDAGILIHRYGPHIFHTNSKEVFEYLSTFTRWRPYEHRVRASVDGQLVPIPINLDTINQLYGLKLTSLEMENFFASVAEPRETVRTSEDVVVGRVGRELYEKFFRGYTRMFENLLDHDNIKILLNTDYREIVDAIPYERMIYTGPVDEFFDYRYGKLPYRSLKFEHETVNQEWVQPVAVVNYPNEHLYTRVTEFKHLTGQEHRKSSLVYEYPMAEGDPYYPVPRPENNELYKKYQALAEERPDVHFVGRLATYKYYNMDQVVAQALSVYARIVGQKRSEATRAEAARPAAPTVLTPRKERRPAAAGSVLAEASAVRKGA